MSEHTTDKHNPLISVKEFPDDGRLQIINSYGKGGFRIAKKSVIGAQFVLQRQTLAWPVRTEQDISADDLLSLLQDCLLYTSPSPRDRQKSRMPSSA